MKDVFKILSIDGGGIRGVIPCTIIDFIERETGFPTSSLFNLVAGTSTGGIIAMGLTKQDENGANAFSAAQMRNLYFEHGAKIFSGRKGGLLSWISKDLFGVPYDNTQIEEVLKAYFADSKLSEALINTLVTTYDMASGKPYYFSSRLSDSGKDKDFMLREVARSTSAAPTYFKPNLLEVSEDNGVTFIDGGVFANNPSILAYSEGKELWKRKRLDEHHKLITSGTTKGFNPDVKADDDDLPFFLLSLGTGHTNTSIDGSAVNKWRNKDWFEPLMTNIFMRGVAENTHFTMQHLLPDYKNGDPRYLRLDFEIPEAYSDLDNAGQKNLEKLVDYSEAFINQNKDKLLKICNILIS